VGNNESIKAVGKDAHMGGIIRVGKKHAKRHMMKEKSGWESSK